jgi:Phage integrase, N-terminal SAM-like domain
MLNLKSNNQCFEGWIKTKEPPFVRRSLERDYRQAFNHHIIPYMGKTELDGINVDTLENFRIYLVEERKLTSKTARNIIDGPLRAMFRDSRRHMKKNPFDELR